MHITCTYWAPWKSINLVKTSLKPGWLHELLVYFGD